MATQLIRKAVSTWNTKAIVLLKRQAIKGRVMRFVSSLNEPRNLENLVSESEKVVGFSTSLLRCLLSDEISSVLVHSKKLVGSRHPLVNTARRLVYDGNDGFEAIGLIVLLMSRAGETLMSGCPPLGQDPVSGVHHKQRKLAEVAEMIKTGYMVHLGVVNKTNFSSDDDVNVMNFGNKISILTGDFFLAKASVGLSELENTEVVDIMAGVIGDIVEGEMSKDYGQLNDLMWKDWEEIVFKCKGSLVAKSCWASLKLCSLSQLHQDAGYVYGKNLAFLQQLQKDYQTVTSPNIQSISTTNATVILMKDRLSKYLVEKNKNSTIFMDETTADMIRSKETINKMKDMCDTYGQLALKSLENFPVSEARTCLENLVKHLIVLKSVN